MDIEYTLEEADLIELAKFQLEKSDTLQKHSRSRRKLYPLGFSFLALGYLLISDDLILPIMFGLLAILSFFFAPMIFTWLTYRRLPRIVKSRITPTSIGNRRISVNEKGLQQHAGEIYSEVPWNIVNDLADEPNYVFVAIENNYSLIIPKDEVNENELTRFVSLIRSKIMVDDA